MVPGWWEEAFEVIEDDRWIRRACTWTQSPSPPPPRLRKSPRSQANSRPADPGRAARLSLRGVGSSDDLAEDDNHEGRVEDYAQEPLDLAADAAHPNAPTSS